MFIIDFTFTASDETLAEFRPMHINHLKPFYAKGIFHIGGRKSDGTGGLIIAENQDIATLRKILDQDPFIKNGCAVYSLTEFFPVLTSDVGKQIVN